MEMSDHIEEWRVIPGYPDYDVSNQGHIRSNRSGMRIKKQTRPNGTNEVLLYADKIQSRLSVAKLVWNAFNEPVERYARFEHINGDPADDRLVNLKLKEKLEGKMKLTKEEFAAGLTAAKENKEDAPGSVAAEIETDLKRERTIKSQLPVKETPESVKAAVKETPEKPNPFLNNPLAMPKLSGSIKGPIEDVVDLLHKAGFYGITVTAWFPDQKK